MTNPKAMDPVLEAIEKHPELKYVTSTELECMQLLFDEDVCRKKLGLDE